MLPAQRRNGKGCGTRTCLENFTSDVDFNSQRRLAGLLQGFWFSQVRIPVDSFDAANGALSSLPFPSRSRSVGPFPFGNLVGIGCLGAIDGSENTFQASGSGQGQLTVRMAPGPISWPIVFPTSWKDACWLKSSFNSALLSLRWNVPRSLTRI